MVQRIHVHHVVLSLQPGGLENGVVNVINRLNPERFQSSLCCLMYAGEFAGRLDPSRVAIHEMGHVGGNNLMLPLRLARLFLKIRPDIVHTRNVESFYYAFIGAKLARVNSIIHSEHGRTFNDRPLRHYVQRRFSRHIDSIFAVTHQLKGDLVERIGLPASAIRVLHNGVDLAKFAAHDRDETRHNLGFKDNDFVVGSVGRLAAVKNYPILLRTVAAMRHENVRVVLVGDGPERDALEGLAASLGIAARTTFLGHREDVPQLIGAMDTFVLPSLSEGMSNTLLEAMAIGVPVVASSVGGNPEIIDDARVGALFESDNAAALLEKLGKFHSNAELRTRIGLAGRQRVLANFSIDAMISRYENLYEEVAAMATWKSWTH